ncbi:MAG: phosphatidate cytidylyltransferase [Hydrogenophaga sp.]|nr:phosphatidate cytidylyltransferase [Hydrogenophaga sp.]
MLRQRVITALLLLAVLLPAMFHEDIWPFAALSVLMVGAAGWEWARMNASSKNGSLLAGMLLAATLLVFWQLGGLAYRWSSIWTGASFAWLLLALVMLRRGISGWNAWNPSLRMWGGLILLAVAWLALVQSRQTGLVFLLSILTLVWAADIAAYAGGKAFGRRKLAPTLSPGKSWEGAFSGLLGVMLLAWFWVWFDRTYAAGAPSLFTRLWQVGPVWTLVSVIALTVTSVIGDLLESLVKRGAGMKDSSQLLPGHGGILDRVDALLPVLPVAMMIVQVLEN